MLISNFKSNQAHSYNIKKTEWLHFLISLWYSILISHPIVSTL